VTAKHSYKALGHTVLPGFPGLRLYSGGPGLPVGWFTGHRPTGRSVQSDHCGSGWSVFWWLPCHWISGHHALLQANLSDSVMTEQLYTLAFLALRLRLRVFPLAYALTIVIAVFMHFGFGAVGLRLRSV